MYAVIHMEGVRGQVVGADSLTVWALGMELSSLDLTARAYSVTLTALFSHFQKAHTNS